MDFDRAEFLRSKGLAPDCLLVGSIGELRTLKRHDDFIQAAAIVTQNFPDAQFVLAGVEPSESGEVRKQLEQLVTQLRLDGRFHFLGWLDDAEQWLGALDVFVSASESESFGLAIAEAMAAETAVVATETEGAQEVITRSADRIVSSDRKLGAPCGGSRLVDHRTATAQTTRRARKRICRGEIQSATNGGRD